MHTSFSRRKDDQQSDKPVFTTDTAKLTIQVDATFITIRMKL